MQCKCGGMILEYSHVITGKATKRLWAVNALNKPVKFTRTMEVEQHICQGCGRQHHYLWSALDKPKHPTKNKRAGSEKSALA